MKKIKPTKVFRTICVIVFSMLFNIYSFGQSNLDECRNVFYNEGDLTVTTSSDCASKVVTYGTTAYNRINRDYDQYIAQTYTFTGATERTGSGTGSGQSFNYGITYVSITLSVPSNTICEKNSTTFKVTVLCPPCIAPVFSSCPANITKSNDAGKCGANIEYEIGTSGDESTYSYEFSGATSGSGNGTGSGVFFSTGVTNVTVTATNDCGEASCEFTVTVNDTEKPKAVCKAITVTLSDGEAVITADDVDGGSSDNCAIVSKEINLNRFSCADAGSVITVVLTVKDANGNTSTCNAEVSVDGVVPDVEIAQLSENFCGQEADLNATAIGGSNLTYSWSTNETSQNIVVSSSGEYIVTATNEYGCASNDTVTVNFTSPSALSAYTIIATDEVELKYSSKVESGGVGASGCDGEIEVKGSSSIYGNSTFAKAKKIEVDNGSSIQTQYEMAIDIDLPDFKYNPYCEEGEEECKSKYHNKCESDCHNKKHEHCKSNCKEKNHSKKCKSKYHKYCKSDCDNKKHEHCKSNCKKKEHNHCKSSNCSDNDHHHCSGHCHSKYHKNCDSKCKNSEHKHCKSKCKESSHNHCSNSNCSEKGNNISVGSNKTVTLTDSIYGKISLGKNSKVIFTNSTLYIKELKTSDDATITFNADCVEMMVCDDVELSENNVFNSSDKSVILFVENSFKAKEGSTVNSSIYSQKDIDIDGSCKNTSNMKGLFIADKVKSKYTTWNKNSECGTCKQLGKRSLVATEDLSGLIDPTKVSFSVYPNPSKGFFGLDVMVPEPTTINIVVTDYMGRVVLSETRYLIGPEYVTVNIADGIAGNYLLRTEINGQVFMNRITLLK